ncbi:ATP-binding protein [Tranquillimonas alkanivorans]|uniref:ATP-binding protein n=1 Tax=Tranquillimonas alkanivorans TaxID=441119 RepID=UPI001160C12C|nr:ATP-binding protein [Tranquillimonas alkanivorans]
MAALLSLTLLLLISVVLGGLRRDDIDRDRSVTDLNSMIETRTVIWSVRDAVREAEIAGLRYAATGEEASRDRSAAILAALQALLVRLDRLTEDTTLENDAQRLIAGLRDWTDAGAFRAQGGADLTDHVYDTLRALITAASAEVAAYARSERRPTVALTLLASGFQTLLIALILILGIAGFAYVRQTRRGARALRLAHEATEAALRRAEEANRSKSEFLAAMSHEIRTPLNGIIGYSELISDTELNRVQRRYLERVQFAGSALLATVDDILDFSKIEAGHVQLRPHAFSLSPLVNNAASIVADQAERKGLVLNLDLAEDLPDMLLGDENRIRQVLLNLMNNAVKFTERGQVRVAVDRIDHASGPCIRFTVEDTGIGISEEQIDRLFDQFYQVSQVGRPCIGGTGLGLAISKRLTEAMGGEIGVRSQPGEGSAFWFTIPCRYPTADERAALADEAVPTSASAKGARLLLVEDLEYNRDLATVILAGAGYFVAVARDGLEAIEMVKAEPYDLVLMDIQMPGLDGLAATERIRALGSPVADVPILAMTANVLPHQIKKFGEVGMTGHVAKPFRKGELLEKVAVCLSRTEASAPTKADSGEESDILALLGPRRAEAARAELRRRVSDIFSAGTAGAGRPDLAQRAHELISLSSMLGHMAFAEACVALEEACREGVGVEFAFARAGEAAVELSRGSAPECPAESA